MTNRPISPELHGILDYGLTVANTVVPGMLNMSTKAKSLFRTIAVIQGGLGAVTDQPLAVQRIVPFPMHGLIDKASAPLYLLAPFVTGVFRERKARNWWLLVGTTLVVVYNLTDWSQPKPGKKRKRR